LLTSTSGEIGQLLDEVLALGVPLLGVISDHQKSIVLAVEQHLPGVPHQVCQFHYLQQIALPAVNEDRHFRRELRKPLRPIRQLEQRVQQQQAQGKLPAEEAQVVEDYCLAIRSCVNQDGKYPLSPPGLKLYENLSQIAASIDRCLQQQESAALRRVKKLVSVVRKFRQPYQRLHCLFTWIWQIAGRLEASGTVSQACSGLLRSVKTLTPPWSGGQRLRAFRQHALKITQSFGHRLFAYLDQPLLPPTNNEMEVFIGRLKKRERHVSGRKATHQVILRQGAAVAIYFGLPQPIKWPQKFAAVSFTDFRTSLARLRRQPYRSKLWLIRRDLDLYLSTLERHWRPPPHSE
jgi:hypothetical protein